MCLQGELERLNGASEEINKLELELDVSSCNNMSHNIRKKESAYADQRLCFCFTDSTSPLLLKSKI